MEKLTKEQYEARFAEQSEEQKSQRGTAVAKKVYDWQEKSGAYAWDAESLAEETGIIVTNTFEMEYIPKGQTLPVRIEFTRTEGCAEREGMNGKYKLMRLEDKLWRIERVESASKQRV